MIKGIDDIVMDYALLYNNLQYSLTSWMMNNKKTLILGATTDSGRYANLAAHRLISQGYTIVNVGLNQVK